MVLRLIAKGLMTFTEASTTASIDDVQMLNLYLDAEDEAQARAEAKANARAKGVSD